MTEAARKQLRPIIEENAIAYAIGTVSVEEIDEINILRASFKAMHNAVAQLKIQPAHVLIDGNRFTPYPGIPHTCIIGGDGRYMNIAAASVLAKTYRDDYMDMLHDQFPQYAWMKNKGYGTVAHRTAIAEFGATEHHRKSFRLLPAQLEMF
jgi:ribonuclease HII